jgi:hypothetical protein
LREIALKLGVSEDKLPLPSTEFSSEIINDILSINIEELNAAIDVLTNRKEEVTSSELRALQSLDERAF